MPDIIVPAQIPNTDKPLAGLTILAVEDSRFASEALRLLCRTSGARLRRANTLAAAYRHLSLYRPSAAIIDIGLPDGSGCDLIAALAAARPRVAAIIATSGDPGVAAAALAAGAHRFLLKPIRNMLVLHDFLAAPCPAPPPAVVDMGCPDPLALRDDLRQADALLDGADAATCGYVAGFVGGLARATEDRALADAAQGLAGSMRGGRGPAALQRLIRHRLAAAPGL
jgi:CheY-like chemotaxis protein